MEDPQARTRMLVGSDALERLRRSRVAVFGCGGVGGHCVEALARAGVGTLDLYDNDTVSPTNLNRQLLALHSTLGQYKVDAARDRIRDIDPTIQVHAVRLFYLPETADQVDLSAYDYVVDAIDTVIAKLELAQRCYELGIPLLSCMGAANKLDPTAFVVTDIYQTSMCPLARVMRRELKKRGIPALKVVYSTEPAVSPAEPGEPEPGGRRVTPASISYVPAAAGLVAAGAVLRDLGRF